MQLYLFFRSSQKPLHNTEHFHNSIGSFIYVTSDVLNSEQPSPYSQLTVPIFPLKHFLEKNPMVTSMTSKLRKFLLISSIIYFIWSILAIGLTIALTITSYDTLYYDLSAGSLLIGAGINLCLVLHWISDAMTHLIHMFSFTFILCTIASILLATDYTRSKICLYSTECLYSSELISNLQLAFVFVFMYAALHNVINLVVTYNVRTKIRLTPLSSVV
jgi:hypothetical protein